MDHSVNCCTTKEEPVDPSRSRHPRITRPRLRGPDDQRPIHRGDRRSCRRDRSDGGAFTLFGGGIHGRQIELVPGIRVVQAWRPKMWEPGVCSLVRFTLVAEGTGTKVILDHSGFPVDPAQDPGKESRAHGSFAQTAELDRVSRRERPRADPGTARRLRRTSC
ncbi:MAG: SRPBCC domain-containing protein [Deltaproteobacteria bacterium]|nr:SRPBCC domain-containing protein [Deltaproteobacteria bacterium]